MTPGKDLVTSRERLGDGEKDHTLGFLREQLYRCPADQLSVLLGATWEESLEWEEEGLRSANRELS